MARMNSALILAGRRPNILDTMIQSDFAAQRQSEFQRQNALADAMQQYGPGVLAGDQNALAEYGKFDLPGAMAAQGQHNANRRADNANATAMRRLEFEMGRYAQGLSEEQRAREAEEARKAAALLSRTQTEEEYNQVAEMLGMPKGQFAQKDLNLDLLRTSAELLEPVKAQSAPGKVQADINEGILPEGTPLRGDPMQIVLPGGEAGGAPLPSTVPGQGNVPGGSGAAAFGASGFFGGAANRVTDFAVGKEVFPDLADNQRFFKAVEGTMLPIITQAYRRQPAQQLMQQLQDMFANVGTFEGAQAALKDSRLLKQRFEADLSQAKIFAAQAKTPAAQQEAARRVLLLESAVEQMTEALRRLEPAPEGGAVSDDVMQRLERY